ncbi:DUF4962 domain-containing protein [Cyclobacterium amurskyense]|uniref:Uncharacterized protein n=1 Tax=Cyclobacterium amurskyense TaxID=320787 RepID=A0A0H4PSK0_9BACT|nr:DUF4962 domain-containing protein [Cyclobacterium amurskyense]AKP51277.1 hypothetical protein CA2015_1845 [Cyclobacterium amurskyense]
MKKLKDNLMVPYGLSSKPIQNYSFLTLGFVLFCGLIILGCGEKMQELAFLQKPNLLKVVYPRYLDYPKPSAGMLAQLNPPVLRWPLIKGENIHYDVRLSTEKDFSTPNKILEIKNSPWAMFNPHQILESGSWYWQFKQSGEDWSNVQHFKVDDGAIPMVSHSAEQFLRSLPNQHPRVLATAPELGQLRRLEPNADTRAIINNAELALLAGIPKEQDGMPKRKGEEAEQERKLRLDASKELGTEVYDAVVSLSEAYILSGKEVYAEKAIQMAIEVSNWDPKGVSSTNDFSDARCMLAMAMVYDTFYDRLSEKQKSTLLESIKARASHFYEDWVNNIEAKVLSGHVWQHILHYFFQTSLAVYGDEPEAAKWMAYAYELFLARAPVLGGMDGGWSEGVSYFRMNMETMIDIPLYIKKFTGFDFINAHPWYQNQADWMIYHIPPGTASDGFADNSEEVNAPGVDYVAFALELAKLTGNPRAVWYSNECLKYDKSHLSEEPVLRWIRLTKTRNLPIPDLPTQLDLPMGRSFTDIGLVAMHSEITNTKDNLMVAMRSSPFGSYGHMLSDQNVFNILYGGKKLFYRTGYKVSMKDPHRTGWYQHTKSQNGILVDGAGQPYSTEAFGWIARFLQADELAYAKGDASQAYQSKETGEEYSVVKNFRHLVMLKPDVVLFYDELEATKEVDWSWLIHSLEEMTIDENNQTFAVQLENGAGKGRLWASEDLTFHLSDTFEVAAVNWRKTLKEDGSLKSYKDNQYHLKASSTSKAAKMRFFAVIQAGKVVKDTELMEGKIENGIATIKIGDWNITANLASEIEPGLQIHNEATETVFSSHGNSLQLGDQIFSGEHPGSTRMGIIKDNSPLFLEIKDQFPNEMISRFNYFQKGQQK